ncbi:MAG: hypothetical protein Q8S43_06400 [Actinomycetota bacterium]|nr:hypothetical protein [Actinomycetota bacterium]
MAASTTVQVGFKKKPIRESGLLRFLGVCGFILMRGHSHVIPEEGVERWCEFRIDCAVGLDEDPLEEDLVELLLDAIGRRSIRECAIHRQVQSGLQISFDVVEVHARSIQSTGDSEESRSNTLLLQLQ